MNTCDCVTVDTYRGDRDRAEGLNRKNVFGSTDVCSILPAACALGIRTDWDTSPTGATRSMSTSPPPPPPPPFFSFFLLFFFSSLFSFPFFSFLSLSLFLSHDSRYIFWQRRIFLCPFSLRKIVFQAKHLSCKAAVTWGVFSHKAREEAPGKEALLQPHGERGRQDSGQLRRGVGGGGEYGVLSNTDDWVHLSILPFVIGSCSWVGKGGGWAQGNGNCVKGVIGYGKHTHTHARTHARTHTHTHTHTRMHMHPPPPPHTHTRHNSRGFIS